jgi:DnaK suppressor protein
MYTEEQMKQLEARLLRDREEAIGELDRFNRGMDNLREQAGELTLYRFHMADIGTETMEKEKEFLFASREGRRLYEIDEALRRFYRDPETFGTCERCGGKIRFERLDIIPEARMCAECQKLSEAEPVGEGTVAP